MAKIPNQDLLLVMGGMKAKGGSENNKYEREMSKNGNKNNNECGVMDSNGERLV